MSNFANNPSNIPSFDANNANFANNPLFLQQEQAYFNKLLQNFTALEERKASTSPKNPLNSAGVREIIKKLAIFIEILNKNSEISSISRGSAQIPSRKD